MGGLLVQDGEDFLDEPLGRPRCLSGSRVRLRCAARRRCPRGGCRRGRGGPLARRSSSWAGKAAGPSEKSTTQVRPCAQTARAPTSCRTRGSPCATLGARARSDPAGGRLHGPRGGQSGGSLSRGNSGATARSRSWKICVLGLRVPDDQAELRCELLNDLECRVAPRGKAQVHDYVIDPDRQRRRCPWRLRGVRRAVRELITQPFMEPDHPLIQLPLAVPARGAPLEHRARRRSVGRFVHRKNRKIETHGAILHPVVIDATHRANVG